MAYLRSSSFGTFEEFISDERLKMLFGKRKIIKEVDPDPIEDRWEILDLSPTDEL